MANGTLFVGWGPAIPGRELKGLAVFNEVIQYYGGLQQRGEIERFEPVALEPHGGDLWGFLLVYGDQEKLNQLRASEEFQRLVTRGATVVQSFGVVTALTGDALNQLFQNYQQQISDLVS